MEPFEVFRIIDAKTGAAQGVYSRACHDEYDFPSVDDARRANCHGIHEDKAKYKIARYRVTYELIDEDCDPATEEERKAARAKEEEDAALDAEWVEEKRRRGIIPKSCVGGNHFISPMDFAAEVIDRAAWEASKRIDSELSQATEDDANATKSV